MQVQGQSAEEAFGQGLGLIRGSAGADLSGEGIQPSCCRVKIHIRIDVVRHGGTDLHNPVAALQVVGRERFVRIDLQQGQG